MNFDLSFLATPTHATPLEEARAALVAAEAAIVAARSDPVPGRMAAAVAEYFRASDAEQALDPNFQAALLKNYGPEPRADAIQQPEQPAWPTGTPAVAVGGHVYSAEALARIAARRVAAK